MPNCDEEGCIARVDDEGMLCRVHQLAKEGGDDPDVRVTYVGDGMAQMSFGNMTKGLVAFIPKSQADKLAGDKDWKIG